MKRRLIWLPLIAFAALATVAVYGLFRPDNSTIRSALVGQPLPDFTLPAMVAGKPGLTRADMTGGGPRLLNIFGSWCIPCIAEAPQLMQLKQRGIAIDAIAIRDTGAAVRRFLSDHGDPYVRIGDDPQSRVQLSLGSSGVPETFVIDAEGRIAHQHIGPINASDVPAILKALEDAR
ncbi:DsbE family thiol:disulfide interchange protein [Sphingomonas sp.]|uniref:DsbE family thiol:disulfide interchange protein n=1 Tax=Sphingomonas sp. TaxID=28214 RepID=UPI002BED0624|nr:DsbE family thiol:disulfide interchange protein [Sphingomonas sp.]HTG38324.1 DsbE family thiol:disulfide interchange protein [Sphingomonas sp.]